MKYKGVFELSVREYVGIEDGATAWRHQKYAIGIQIGNEVYDYKTLEKYNFLDRTLQGVIDLKDEELVKGKIYAISTARYFKKEKEYTDHQIEKYMKSMGIDYYPKKYILDEPKVKQLLKQK